MKKQTILRIVSLIIYTVATVMIFKYYDYILFIIFILMMSANNIEMWANNIERKLED